MNEGAEVSFSLHFPRFINECCYYFVHSGQIRGNVDLNKFELFNDFILCVDSQFRTSRVFRVDHEEDVLMIHYDGENETPLPRMVRWNENGYAVPMLDDNSGDHGL